MKLQAKTILFLVPAIVIWMLALGWIAYAQLRDASERELFRQMATLLDDVELHVDTHLQTAMANVELFAGSSLVGRYLLAGDDFRRDSLRRIPLLTLFSSYHAAYPQYYEIRVLLPDGFEDSRSTSRSIPNVREHEGLTEYFERMTRAKDDRYSEFFRNPDNEEHALLVSNRIELKDPSVDPALARPLVRGYLAITSDLDFLEQRVNSSRLGDGGFLFFADRQGNVLFHPDAARKNQPLPDRLFRDLVESLSDSKVLKGAHWGTPSFFEGRRLHDNLYAFGVLPEREVLAASRSVGVAVAAITLAAILVTTALLFALLRTQILTPIRKLGFAAQEIGRGNLVVDVNVDRKDELGQLASSFSDMGKSLRRSSEQIQHLADHDSLTGLPNRRMFSDYLVHALAHAKRHSQRLALLFLDLDNFKRVNDTSGHDAGDQLLREMANRCSACLRAGDHLARAEGTHTASTVARLGADEFIILLPDISHFYETATVAERLLDELSHPFAIGDKWFQVSASIGIATFPDDAMDAQSLIKNADTAMCHAKECGKNNYQYYKDSMNMALVDRLNLEAGLHEALRNRRFVLHYQPLVDVRTGKLNSVEALIRWRHPEKGLIAPHEFIPLAEETGLIIEIGEWVLTTACTQAKAWQDAGYQPIRVAVNISNAQFNKPNFESVVRQTLARTGYSPEYLEIELTETSIIQAEASAMRTLDAMKSIGVHISMDDFGIGYSSLSALRRLPIDTVKIDQSFVKDIETDEDDAAIVSAIIAMTRRLNLCVAAEGVEHRGELEFLRREGCDLVQGYYISPPLTADDVSAMFDEGVALIA